MIVYLNNNDKLEMDGAPSAFDVAVKLGIKKNAIAANVNGEKVDLVTLLKNNDTVNILTTDCYEGLQILRHSAAHVLAMALQEIDPSVELAIGPSIENGFYYDIKSSKSFSTDDLQLIEEKMREILKRKLSFKRKEISKEEAIEIFTNKHQSFKLELIKDIPDETVSLYYIGDEFVDLCKGPHVPSTSYISEDAFKLTTVAGAYWRGDSSKPMLQRIYGTVFSSKKEMKEYFTMMEEAQARDHRKLGVELELFHIDEAAPGNIFWLKNGFTLLNTVKTYISNVIKRYGYFQVQTPQVLNKSLWETSGHWEKFRENMFVVESEETPMAIKPMNCPGHIIIYKNGSVKSYRDLPLRMAEFGVCHRNESSGSLHGLMRLRAFTQDDGHCFCTPGQIVSETMNICSALKEIYAAFGFTEIEVKFSDRPAKRIGADEVWDLAEKSLKEAANAAGLSYTLNKGEGAFYGPKLEFVLKDCLGRDWQCGTIQVDFSLPERFNISYIDMHGNKQTPVMIHRAIIGSFDRFIGILIENYAGKFPFWLAPVQIAIASVTEESAEYAKEINQLLESQDFRVILDIENEKINYKIREYSVKKVPSIIILGKKEVEERTVSIRSLGSNDTVTIPLAQLIAYFAELAKTPK